jgi:endonuclease/exonuclease/phosphatase (EEP) superfamily protein YafD
VQKIRLRLAAVAAILAPLATFTTQAPAGADVVPATTTVRVATFNIQVRRSLDDFSRGVTGLLGRSDIIGLQEMNSREKEAFLQTLDASGWAHVAIRPSFQEPVLWRTDRFAFVSARAAQVSAATYIGNEVPSMKATQKARYVTVVRLLDKVTGRRVAVVNAHLIQGAVRGGRAWVGRPRLFGIYARSLANVAAIAASEQKWWGRVFVIGDFNAGWVADSRKLRKLLPIRTMGRVGLRSMWTFARPSNGLGTHNDALIDQVFSNLPVIGSAVQFDLSGYSDHRPAIATFATD